MSSLVFASSLSKCVELSCIFFVYSFALTPAGALQVRTPLPPNQTSSVSLPLGTQGNVTKMDPLNNLQVKYGSTLRPLFSLSAKVV